MDNGGRGGGEPHPAPQDIDDASTVYSINSSPDDSMSDDNWDSDAEEDIIGELSFHTTIAAKICNLEILLCSELDALRQDSERSAQRIIEQVGRGAESEERLELLLDSLKALSLLRVREIGDELFEVFLDATALYGGGFVGNTNTIVNFTWEDWSWGINICTDSFMDFYWDLRDYWDAICCYYTSTSLINHVDRFEMDYHQRVPAERW
jgi:hypothetical protein